VTSAAAVSIVIPAYDEARRLPALVEALSTEVDKDWEVVIVDDGSSDGTSRMAESALAAHGLAGTVLVLPDNIGKGAALRAGVAASTGRVVVSMDADLATDLAALAPLVAALDDHDIAVGSRNAPGAVVLDDSRVRRVGARVFNRIVRLATGLPVTDTQCGFKAFRGDLARRLFAASEADRWGQDVEVLDLGRRIGATIVEVPVVWTAIEGSSVRVVRDALATIAEIAAHILRRRRVLRGLVAWG
jgi:glycosyltransferase involved in cell wall biosynthesis